VDIRRIGSIALIGLVVGACGGGGSSSQAPAATTAASTPTAPPAATQGAAATTDPLAVVSQFEGTYTGTWTNTTFGSTGPASISVALDRATGTITLTLTLGGNVFGQPSPAPETLTATITPGQPVAFTSKTFGPTTVDFDPATKALTFTSNDVPSARVKTFVAKATIADPKTIDLTYDVTFRDATPPAHGTAKLTR